ncbi:alpha-galactosidase [Nitzschia inconspicua]|uniref:alpha-galactosidase n=1 Tax=Nitzschia inconspicua TaxID=303405 RepID=A0A9K3KG30_9STRA|nr:alpha-galactosidase [Nitzschia inconspicua]
MTNEASTSSAALSKVLLKLMALITVVLNIFDATVALENGLGLTPPMGFNTWNKFACDIHEDLVKDMAHAMVDSGLDKLGYQYINLDDCWQITRNETGYIVEDPNAFPSGMASLIAHVHDLGLKFGLYSDAGLRTCAIRPGSLGYETKDAVLYAEWEVDFLKYDNCWNLGKDLKTRYQTMSDALNATGRPIFFSLCEWGDQDPATWAQPIGNMWRTFQDIRNDWNWILSCLDYNDKWHQYAGPGGWNDPDILEVGNGVLSIAESRSHFTLWALVKAPLLLGNDLRNMTSDVFEIISNEEVIALNQDPLGIQGNKRLSMNETEVWAGELSNNEYAIVLFNRSDKEAEIVAKFDEIGIASNSPFFVRDIWMHEDLGIAHSGMVTATVASHDVAAFRLKPVFPPTLRGKYHNIA